ncbi:hypothetical protein, partial [Neptunomonas qingdaonensis]
LPNAALKSIFILQLFRNLPAAKPDSNHQSQNPEKMLNINILLTSIFSFQLPIWQPPWEEVRILQTPQKESTGMP